MRAMNNRQILQLIRQYGPIARPDLAFQTGLGLSTISIIVAELIQAELVREVGEAESTGGRRPSLLDLNPNARYAFAMKVAPDRFWVSLVDLKGKPRATVEVPLIPPVPWDDLAQMAVKQMETLRTKHRVAKRWILGIGVSTSGLIDPHTGVCRSSPLLGWNEVPVRETLERMTRLDVLVENDVNAYAFGMWAQENEGGRRNLICITTGPGVGAGIILEGKLYHGSQGGAGEFGHTTIDLHGPPCKCGRRGCLEVLASDQFLLARATDLAGMGRSARLLGLVKEGQLTPASFYKAAQAGDEVARLIYRELGEHLGCGLVNLINLFNPDKIILGGEGVVAAPFFMDTVRQTVKNYAFPHLADSVEIVVDDGGEEVWLQGAALLVVEQFFQIPAST